MKLKGVTMNTRPVGSKVDKEANRRLKRFGAFVRQTARRSIRKTKKVSQPGEPPRGHTGHLKRLILYHAQVRPKLVVIGPLQFRNNIADVIEYGGTTKLQPRGGGQATRVQYAGRPFMTPAFEKEKKEHAGDLLEGLF